MYLALRIRYALSATPKRVSRLLAHLGCICLWRLNWWTDLGFYLLDLIFFFDSYEILSNLISFKTRRLTAAEVAILRSVFKDALPYELIRIDEQARIGPPQYRICYVSFHTINSWGPMSLVTLVHEAVHVWQYRQVGAVYIPRALRAQRTTMGYNYGGLEKLKAYPNLSFYNYEQQADIIADAYALREGFQPRWTTKVAGWETVFLPFLEEVSGAENSQS